MAFSHSLGPYLSVCLGRCCVAAFHEVVTRPVSHRRYGQGGPGRYALFNQRDKPYRALALKNLPVNKLDRIEQ